MVIPNQLLELKLPILNLRTADTTSLLDLEACCFHFSNVARIHLLGSDSESGGIRWLENRLYHIFYQILSLSTETYILLILIHYSICRALLVLGPMWEFHQILLLLTIKVKADASLIHYDDAIVITQQLLTDKSR